jgi:hypothetical protein
MSDKLQFVDDIQHAQLEWRELSHELYFVDDFPEIATRMEGKVSDKLKFVGRRWVTLITSNLQSDIGRTSSRLIRSFLSRIGWLDQYQKPWCVNTKPGKIGLSNGLRLLVMKRERTTLHN